MADSSLNRRVGISALWTIATRMGLQAIGVVSSIITARILGPQLIGLYEKAAVLVGFLAMLTTMGLQTTLVQKRNATRDHYDTVWTLSILEGLITALPLVLIMPWADTWFRAPGMSGLLGMMALAQFIRGFENVGMVEFRRELEFDKEFRFMLYRRLALFIVAVSIALIWKTVWALAWATLIAAIIGVLISFRMSPYRPRLTLVAWRELFHFVKWMFTFETVAALSSKIEGLLLLRLGTPTDVALYNRSDEIGSLPSTEIAMPMVRAVLPGLVKAGDDVEHRNALFLTFLVLALTVALPASVGLALVAPSLVIVLLGAAWLPMVPLLQILTIRGVSRVVAANATSIYVAAGRVGLMTKLTTFNLCTRVPLLLIGFFHSGLLGLAWASFAAAIISNFTTLYWLRRLGALKIRQLWTRIWRVLVACGFMAGAVFWVRQFEGWQAMSPAARLFAESGFGAMVFVLAVLVLWLISGRPSGSEELAVNMLKARLKR